MTFNQLLSQLIDETTQKSLGHFSPELALCVTIVGLLMLRMVAGKGRGIPGYIPALLGVVVAFGLAYYQLASMGDPGSGTRDEFFTGLLVYDKFTVFFRLFLLLFLILVIALTVISGIPDHEDSPDFYTLLLGSTVGMMIMASANHLLMLFIGVEMTSVPSYAMVGFLKGRKQSSEAALKYVVYGAGASGVMLYGISLLCGMLGTGDLPSLAHNLQTVLGTVNNPAALSIGMDDATVRTVLLAIMLVLVGVAFKLSLVPFHFWCPDAFEGASAEVAGFLSVASKAGAFALLVRFVLAFAGAESASLSLISFSLGIGLGILAILTATFGNLAAYTQSNMKRLLAYSTIAHAGYMLMAVAAMMIILSAPADSTIGGYGEAARCLQGLLYYLAVYLFMNLGAFAIVALIRNQTYSEQIDDYGGLAAETPVLCVCMGICLFSLVGLPPFGGFVGKLMIFRSLVVAADIHWFMWVVLAFGGLNTVFSLFFYMRVLKAMFLDPRPAGARPAVIPANSVEARYVLLVSLPVVILGIAVAMLSDMANNAAAVLF